jgi:hypothetical protein
MKLTYRGVNYDYTPNPIPVIEQKGCKGQYRGVPTRFYTAVELPERPNVYLTWRGISYCTGTPASLAVPEALNTGASLSGSEIPTPEPAVTSAVAPESQSVPVSETTSHVADIARNLFIRHHQQIRRREQGMMVRLAAEVGIPIDEVAHYESHVQGKVPHDFSGYDRSLTAMS